MPISAHQGERSLAGRLGRLILFGIVGIFDLVAISFTITYKRWQANGAIDPGALIVICVFGGIFLILTLLLVRHFMGRTVYDELDLILAQESLPLGGEQQVTIKLRAKATSKAIASGAKACAPAGQRQAIKPIVAREFRQHK